MKSGQHLSTHTDGVICELWWNDYSGDYENDEDYPITLTLYKDTTYHDYASVNLDWQEEQALGIDEDDRTGYTVWFTPEVMALWNLSPRLNDFVKATLDRWSKSNG